MKTPPKHILVVDDEPGVREALRLMLGVDHHTVVEAKNGAEALDLFLKDRFDLVMTDFEMPVMKGCELAVQIKRLVPSQPILMITAYWKGLGELQNPVDGVLTKPFSLADIRRAMARLLS